MHTLLYISLVVIAYVYVGYPLLLRANALGRPRRFLRARIHPTISIIVPAHDEEANIGAKLRNLLALDYPRDRVEILIGSDGSSDRTEAIVRAFTHEGVGLISFPKQLGKSAMQNGLVDAASGEILVFTDADCLLHCEALRLLAEHFTDARVGLVTTAPRYVNADETSVTSNESLYLRYETWMRSLESDRGLLAMASGSCFAMRRCLWQPLDRADGDDFVLPLRVAEAGLVNRLDPRVGVFTRLSQNRPWAMLRMKARIISKDSRALLKHAALLDPFRRGTLALSLWSHKLLRWLVPYFLMVVLAASCTLRADPPMRAILAMQIIFYALALAGFAQPERSANTLFKIPMSFCLVNLAALVGTLRSLTGRTSGLWTPDRSGSLPLSDPAATHITRAK